MKRYIITITLALGLGMGLNAQNDSFFNYSSDGETNRNASWGMTPALPAAHGMTDHQNAVPVGSGIVLLAGMALGYGIKRKIENVETCQQHDKK